MTRAALIGSALASAVLLGAAAAAQQPRVGNGQLLPRPAGPLAQTFASFVAAQTEVAWIGYAVPSSDRDVVRCCWSGADGSQFIGTTRADACCGSCRLEPQASSSTPPAGTFTAPAGDGVVRLEEAADVVVLFRVADRRVERIRTFSPDCQLDAGGRTVHWLEGVAPAESVRLLAALVDAETEHKGRVSSAAMAALSAHAEPSAAAAVERLARSHPVARIRGDALFWLAQLAGRRAVGTISDAIEKDPETEVKRRAVFALSQLPRDEGVPLLIDVARRNANPVVRKQAMFWLGQSKDPRALEFFAEILK